MIFPEVLLKCIVVDVILLLSATISAVTDVAAFVLVTTVCVQLIVSIKALTTEATLRMPLESTLVDSTGVIVTEFLVLPELGEREELMLMSEDLLVSRTQVTRLSQYLAGMCTIH